MLILSPAQNKPATNIKNDMYNVWEHRVTEQKRGPEEEDYVPHRILVWVKILQTSVCSICRDEICMEKAMLLASVPYRFLSSSLLVPHRNILINTTYDDKCWWWWARVQKAPMAAEGAAVELHKKGAARGWGGGQCLQCGDMGVQRRGSGFWGGYCCFFYVNSPAMLLRLSTVFCPSVLIKQTIGNNAYFFILIVFLISVHSVLNVHTMYLTHNSSFLSYNI